jgi:dihydropteroate synthase
VERLERGRPPETVPVSALPDADLERLTAPRPPLAGLSLDVPRIMGILNVTPDSFSDGGRFLDPAAALARADAMAAADVLDVGGESTRPGAAEIPWQEERDRVLPVVSALRGRRVSIDTRKAAVARAALGAGAAIVNDVSGARFDPEMLGTVAESGAPVVLMHSVGTPETMQRDPRYDDVLHDVLDALEARVDEAVAAGVPRGRIVIDPGIGFGKTRDHTLALLRRIGAFHDLGLPILLGVSRKRFIGDMGSAPQAEDRAPGTLAVTLAAVAQGVQLHRVHDVAEVAQGLALWRAVTEG